MGIYQLTNVPTEASGFEIKGIVDGEDIRIVAAQKPERAGQIDSNITMTSTFVGDHMMSKPAELRRMYANDIATAIALGRDAGYAQAKAEIRNVLGIKAR